jgi:hypothetical protein
MRRTITVVGFVVTAGACGVLGVALGVRAEPGAASFDDLDRGLAVALGVSVDDVRRQHGYHQLEKAGCQSGTCRQTSVDSVPGPGTAIQDRLYDGGWTLVPSDEPECVSDSPDAFGYVCSYERGNVTVSVQVESPGPEAAWEHAVWASTG